MSIVHPYVIIVFTYPHAQYDLSFNPLLAVHAPWDNYKQKLVYPNLVFTCLHAVVQLSPPFSDFVKVWVV